MKLFLFIAAILLSTVCNAQSLGLHTFSHHSYHNSKFNNSNYGMYYRSKDDFVVGTYRNSLNRNTVYAGQTFETYYGFSSTVGLASGYRYVLVPFIAAHKRIGIFNPSIVLADRGVVFHMALEWSLK